MGKCQPDLYLPPLAIATRMVRLVTEHILVAQLEPDSFANLRKIVGIVYGLTAGASYATELGKKERTEAFFQSSELPVKNANGIQ